jgi:hypothetical protein
VAELILYAIPAFVLLLVVELLSFRYARDEDLVGYEARDTRTSLTMGGGNVVINAVWKLAVVFVYVIIWDRIFGSFQGETERPRYGLTKNIRSFRPTRVAFHEFADLARDVRAATSWRHKLGYVFRGPGWSPDGSGGGTRG